MESEKDFLSAYDIREYDRPSLTADIAAFMIRSEKTENYRQNNDSKLSLLLVERAGHPFKGHWALPGGFLQPDETIEDCALREITEETNITPASIMKVGIFSEPGRDPRGWIISVAFASVIGGDAAGLAGGDDASDARWFEVRFDRGGDGLYRLGLICKDTVLNAVLEETETKFGRTSFNIIDSGGLAFDHAKIIGSALFALRESAKDFDVIFDFLPDKFTLTELQKVQETILNISILPANFRRKITDHVVETDEFTKGAGHRPAKLYRRK